MVHSVERLQSLPADRKKLENAYEILPEKKPSTHWRDEYFGLTPPNIKRLDLATREMMSVASSSTSRTESYTDAEMLVAKSWIRVSVIMGCIIAPADGIQANILAAEETYDADQAFEKLVGLGDVRLDAALSKLLADGVVAHANKGRAMAGRNFDVTDYFFKCISKHLNEQHFMAAATVKEELDRAFEDKGSADFSYSAGDGEVMAILNLAAHRRVRLIPINPPRDKFGLMDGDYKTRFMDKSRLKFKMEIRPTDLYVYGNPMLPLPLPPQASALHGERPVPVWFDIHGNFLTIMWHKALAATLCTISMRPGVGVQEVARRNEPSLGVWEVELLVRWMQDAGVAKNSEGGWVLQEWWWLAMSPTDPSALLAF